MLKVTLYTNRNIMVFNDQGEQDPLQNAVDCYEMNQPLLEELLAQPARYYLSKWGEWKHEISQREFEYLLGQRTRDKDLAEMPEALERR